MPELFGIKPLTWELDDDGSWTASSVVGTFHVTMRDIQRKCYSLRICGATLSRHESVDEAKSAAESLYRLAISPALAPATEVVEAAREALEELRDAVVFVINEVGIEHVPWEDSEGETHDCPEDDTCDCEHVVKLDAAMESADVALSKLTQALGVPSCK